VERKERNWLFFLIGVFVVFNIITLSPLVPWQQWLLWSKPTPDETVRIVFGDYQIQIPADGIDVRVGEYVEFVATTEEWSFRCRCRRAVRTASSGSSTSQVCMTSAQPSTRARGIRRCTSQTPFA